MCGVGQAVISVHKFSLFLMSDESFVLKSQDAIVAFSLAFSQPIVSSCHPFFQADCFKLGIQTGPWLLRQVPLATPVVIQDIIGVAGTARVEHTKTLTQKLDHMDGTRTD